MSDKLHINKVRILELPSKQYQGEAYYKGELVAITLKYLNKTVCITQLNKKIDKFNILKGKKVPLMKPDGKEIVYGQYKNTEDIIPDNPPSKTNEEALSDKPLENKIQDNLQSHSRKSVAPKRKPFTPYGLKGYLVDKQGNIRLMLDRRASAQTIVLDPTMFAALADMVQRTQEQHNAPT